VYNYKHAVVGSEVLQWHIVWEISTPLSTLFTSPYVIFKALLWHDCLEFDP
jgi:hypothetical protein